jgi:hypothetical protein
LVPHYGAAVGYSVAGYPPPVATQSWKRLSFCILDKRRPRKNPVDLEHFKDIFKKILLSKRETIMTSESEDEKPLVFRKVAN